METIICHTCGCSLVRLGISEDKASIHHHDGEQYHFCCQGCVDLFAADPEKYLEETSELIVCPTCLAEKPRQWATILNIGGSDIYFCRCPHCVDIFKANPDFYIERLHGRRPNEGVLGHDGCCIKPD
ncbi:MAG: YHS domain-containing protein [Gammaproteobacteria bacterium]|nr:YHS domain-containing protein [Gammaproteobacteria bacterium]